MANQLDKLTIHGIECWVDSRLGELRPVNHPGYRVVFDGPNADDDFSAFKDLLGYIEEVE